MPQKQFYDYNSRGPVESFPVPPRPRVLPTPPPFRPFLPGNDVQLGAIKMANRPRWAGLFVFFPLFLFVSFGSPHNPHKIRCIFNLKSTTKREQRKKRVIDQMGWRWKSSLKYLGGAQWGEWVTRSEYSLRSLFL